MPDSPTQPFSGIFVSYRRDDSSGHAGRLFDKLVDHFGQDRIFMDIDNIEPGEDFVTVIEDAVGSCEILIAVIGRNWLTGKVGVTGRLDNPNDFVRLEIATALRRDIRVIPVLVQRASMPKPQDLPDNLAKFARRNAVELTDLRWQTDVDQLIGVLERVLAKREEAVRLAEAAKQTEADLQRAAEEKQRLGAEQQLRLAEEERAQANVEPRRRSEEGAEARRVEAQSEAKSRRLEEDSQGQSERERLSRAAEESESQRAIQQSLYATREEKQAKAGLSADRSKRRILLIIIASVVVIVCIAALGIVALIWMQQPTTQEQSANRNAGDQQTEQTTPRPTTQEQSANPNASNQQTGQTTGEPRLENNPQILFTGKENYQSSGENWTRYKLGVINRATFPNEMFAPAPDLPPCGLNKNSSRAWVDIFDGAGKRLYGFCALKSSEELAGLWFSLPEGQAPPSSVYIELTDRATNTTYKSMPATIP